MKDGKRTNPWQTELGVEVKPIYGGFKSAHRKETLGRKKKKGYPGQTGRDPNLSTGRGRDFTSGSKKGKGLLDGQKTHRNLLYLVRA